MFSSKRVFLAIVIFGLITYSAISAAAQTKDSKSGAVCGDAAKPECTKDDAVFKPYSLVFKLSQKATRDPQQYSDGEMSEYFYAVLLETTNGYKPNGGCNEISQAKRMAAQGIFPNNKAFTYNYYCDNPGEGENIISYKFAGNTETTHLLAVYGGATQAEADKILALAKKKYPKARIVKMRAVVVEQKDV